MTVRIPGGGDGTILKSWIPCRYVSAEILGLMWVGRIMLRVISIVGPICTIGVEGIWG